MSHEIKELAVVALDAMSLRGEHPEPLRPDGPGWFDSSWELRRGLEVCERWSDDERLRGWVEEFCGAQRAVGRTASPSASTAMA